MPETRAPAKAKKKPKAIAFIKDNCTACSGAPVCLHYCPVPDCMNLVPDGDTIFGIMTVHPALCIGCRKCLTKGPDGIQLDGCPWDAIEMIPTGEFEARYGPIDQEWELPEPLLSSSGRAYK